MIRTQIQLPDALYREVKRIARQQEWSVTEVIRRGAETMARLYPSGKGADGVKLPPMLKSRLKVTDYNGQFFPIEFKASSRVSKHDARGIQAFRETYRNARPGVIVYGGSEPYRISEHAVAIPWRAV